MCTGDDMVALIDAIIIMFLLMGATVGFKRGVITSVVMFVGEIVDIVLSYYLKNPISLLLYKYAPFFNFGGDFEGLTSLNIVLYEGIAFIIVYMLLMIILQLLIKISGGIEKFLKFTIILDIPSKIFGAIFGALEAYLLVFVCLFVFSIFPQTNYYVMQGYLAKLILNSSPVLSKTFQGYEQVFSEIINIKSDYSGDKEEYNKQCLEIILKYKVSDVSAVEKLIESGKLQVKDAEKVIQQYS